MRARREIKRNRAARGAIAVTFAIALPVILGIVGLALDLAFVYKRKGELQAAADMLALDVARKLDGTRAGVATAMYNMQNPDFAYRYRFEQAKLRTNPESLSLAASATAVESDWKPALSISSDAAASGLVYARIDSSKFTAESDDPGIVETIFSQVLGIGSLVSVQAVAVAGPATVNVTPLAICALDPNNAVGTRTNKTPAQPERLNYGFRTGVSYNLLDLSPNTSTPQNFLVNPFDPGTGAVNTAHFSDDYVKPSFCTGSVALPGLRSGATIHIRPLGGLDVHDWLNSRFNSYPAGTGCNATTAPPDKDVREYIGGYSNWYMASTPSPYPSASTSTVRNGTARVSYADLVATDTASGTPTADSFGPLWTYAKPVTTSGATYALTDWSNLYTFGSASVPTPNATKYGSGTPYMSSGHRQQLVNGLIDRRVLNVPLLNCSAGAPSSPAPILAIGRFFMTAKATAGVIPGEFAGILGTESETTSVALYK